jgi:hypothetical protein
MDELRTALPRPADRLPLGASGLAVSPFCLGMSSAASVEHAFALGINFFFVSTDMHWPLYEGVREGLRRLLANGVPRDAFVVAGTTYMVQREFMRVPFDEVLDAVPGLGRIDVLVSGGTYAADYPGRREVLAGLRDGGTIGARALGASFHDRGAVVDAVSAGGLDLAFIRYNPIHIGARQRIFPALPVDRTTRIFNFKSTVGVREVERLRAADPALDVWFPEPADYYRFALARPQIDGVLCAMDEPDHLDLLVDALAEPLAPEEEEHMIELAARAVEQDR